MSSEQAFAPDQISLHDTPASMRVVDARVWDAAVSLDAFIAAAQQHQGFWQATRRLAVVTPDAIARVQAVAVPRRLLVLAEDWCGDAVNTLPVLQRLVEHSVHVELRVLRRDEYDGLMQAHLSNGARAIPVVMVLDADGRHYGWWGSRPSPLQRWRLLEGNAMDKDARSKATRTWYARDRGRTTVDEVLELLERSVAHV